MKLGRFLLVQRIRPSPWVQLCVPQRFARIDIPDPGDARLIQQELLQGTFRSSQARMKFLCRESIRKRIHSQLFEWWAGFFRLPRVHPPEMPSVGKPQHTFSKLQRDINVYAYFVEVGPLQQLL